ncbi:MAG: FixH family protein [bacterium]|nr:FixH family protein [bacterium]
MIKELTGKHVLFLFVLFFGIIFVVNARLIYLSQSSWTGLETYDAYRKGLKYNQQLSVSEAQNTRGWTMTLVQKTGSNGQLVLTATPKNKVGDLLSGLALAVELKRPTHEGIDKTFPLKEAKLGVYTGQIKKISLGKWYLFVTATRGAEVLYRSKNELYLK